MALSGSFVNQFQTGYQLVCEWSATQDINNNQSTITLNFYLQSLGSSYTISSSQLKDLQMVIQANGLDQGWVDYGVNYNVSLSGSQKKFMQNKIKTVTHDSNGNCSPILGGMINFNGVNLSGTVFNQVYCQQTVTLDPIPQNSRLASPIPANFTVGDTGIPYTINQYISGVTNDLVLYVQDSSGVYQTVKSWNNVGTSGTVALTTADNTTIFNLLAQRASSVCLLRVWTFDANNNQIGGNNDTTGTCSAPAATTPLVPNFNIGDTLTVTLNAANSAFTHTLALTFGSYTRTLATQNPNGNFSWNTSLNGDNTGMYGQIPNAASGVGSITCTTYYNGVQVQSPISSSQFTATVVNSNPTFSTINYLDNNPTYSGFTGNNQYIIQNKSDLLAKVLDANKAVAQNSATISKYVATFNGVSITVTSWTAGTDITFDFGTVNVSANQNLTITVYDSRGFTTTLTLNVNIVPYSPPVVNATAARGAGFTSTITMTLSGSYSPCTIGGINKNGLNASQTTWAYGQVGGSLGAAVAISGITATPPSYSAPNWTATMALQNAWNVQIIVTDQLGSTTVNLVVPVGIPIMFIDKVMKAIGIGKFANNTYMLDVAGDTNVDGKLNVNKLIMGKLGYSANSANRQTSGNTWTRVGVVTITQQYLDVGTTIEIVSNGAGSTTMYGGKITFRVKQQNAMGSAPYVNLVLSDPITFTIANFVAVITSTTTSSSIVELWAQVAQSYDQLQYSVVLCTSATNFALDNNYGLYANYSAGTVVNCVADGNSPSGSVTMFASATIPSGWLLCDGSAISRSTYASLFSTIGTTYGAGDGSTTFNLPNLQGRVPVGKNGGTFSALGGSGGEETHTLSAGEMPSHNHTVTGAGTVYKLSSASYVITGNDNGLQTGYATQTTSNAGSGAAHNNLQPYLVMNFIIKI